MFKALVAGLIVGGIITVIFARARRSHYLSAEGRRSNQMTAEEKIIACAQALFAERPEMAAPNREFIRDWAYGNAGLEDEKITVEQVERVLNERSA
jgi:hypothetical protein